jgi:flagellar basal body-associated protein FliL
MRDKMKRIVALITVIIFLFTSVGMIILSLFMRG